MVIVCIREGFGNQLFMYACGYALAKKRDAELVLDTTLLDCGTFRKLELLKTQVEFDRRISYGRKEDFFSRAFINKVKRRKSIGISTKICKERNAWEYNPGRFDAWENVYLYGYWQSYHYFESCAQELRNMIVPKYDMPAWIYEQVQKVQNEESIAIHIRRGDYVGIGCTLPLVYYRKAIAAIKRELPNGKFYVFSDDIKYASEKLEDWLGNAVFWEDNSEENSLNDFFLITACRHQIIANSTFSWWAAYLNKNREKKVYAPVFESWKDSFYPTDWIKISLHQEK